MRTHSVPGAALCVFTGACLIHADGFGVTSVEGTPQSVTPRTLFRIYSMSKPLTGTMICRLADAGVVGLDEPVDCYLPGLAVRGKRDTGGITLRHLLSHQGGFMPDTVSPEGASRDPEGLQAEVLRDVRRCPLVADPGTVDSYSNLGVALAACVAERATGAPSQRLMRDLVLDPLGMGSTTYDPAVAMTHPLAQHHVLDAGGRLVVPHQPWAGARHGPVSLCFSTVLDLARFGSLHLRKGAGPQGRLLRPGLVEQMHRGEVDMHLDVNLRYGLTFYVGPSYDGRDRVGHEGFLEGMWGKLVLAPGHDVGVAWLDNRGPEIAAARYEIIERIFVALGAGPASWRRADDRARPPADPLTLAGRYQRGPGGQAVTIEAEDGRLLLSHGERRLPLSAVAPSVYAADELSPWGDGAPWAPHAGSRRLSAGFVPSAGSAGASHLLLNAIPFQRTPWPAPRGSAATARRAPRRAPSGRRGTAGVTAR